MVWNKKNAYITMVMHAFMPKGPFVSFGFYFLFHIYILLIAVVEFVLQESHFL